MFTQHNWKRVALQIAAIGFAAVAGHAMAATATAPPAPADGCGPGPRAGMRDGRGPGGYGMGYGMGGPDGMGPGMMGGGPGMGMGMGMGMGGGMGPGMGMGPYAWSRIPGMNLTDDQRTRLNRIVDETRKAHWATMGQIMDQQARLRDLHGATSPDTAAIDEVYKSIGKLRAVMYDTSVDAHKRMEAVLTKDQQTLLHKSWQ